MRNLVETYLKEIGDYAFDENGICHLRYENDVDIVVEVDGSVLCLHGEIVRTTGLDPSLLFRRALQINMAMARWMGCKLAYFPVSDSIVYVYLLDRPGLTLDEFKDGLVSFGKSVVAFREELTAPERAASQAAIAPEGAGPEYFIRA